MEKSIILDADGKFTIIVHAAPKAVGKFQWYLIGEPNSDKEYILDGQIYESIVVPSNKIKGKWKNKWLCCKCEVDGEKYLEGCVFLRNNFVDMINFNQFDTIQFFNKDGNIRNDVSYQKSIV